jgi:hypothetical protein
MRLRTALVPAILAMSALGALPAAHAVGCGTATDNDADVIPSKTLDIQSVSVMVSTKKADKGTIYVTLKVGQTNPTGDPWITAGADFYVNFKVGASQYSLWRHIMNDSPTGRAPDNFGGLGVKPKTKMDATSVTWILPKGTYKGLRTGADACSLSAHDDIANAPAYADQTT